MLSKALLRHPPSLILSAGLFWAISPSSAKILFKADFETGDLSQWSTTGIRGQNATPRNIQVVTDMTVNKATSASGRERAAWAAQALQAFSASHGLGVGAGSFRSSSLVYAILGSSGLVGAAFFFLALANLIKPFRASTYRADVDGRQGAGVAAAWAAAIGLAPLVFTGTSADPGALFGLFAGLAMGWRGVAALRRAQPTRWASARGSGLEGAT